MDDIFTVRPRVTVAEIPIAPILDMLVAIIFFLLLSTSFIDLTSQAVPPSRITTVKDPLVPPPISVKLLIRRTTGGLNMVMSWEGLSPGRWAEHVVRSTPSRFKRDTVLAVENLARAFKQQYPNEKNIQIGFSHNGDYQDLISVMDGVHKAFQDVILISSEDAEAAIGKRN